MNNKALVLLSGTSNQPLGIKVARLLKTALGQIEITRFIDNECRVRILEEVAMKMVFVIQSLSEIADQQLVELCLIGQALKNLKAKQVIAVIPWLGYSKQDKEFRRGEAISAQLVAKFIEVAGFDAVVTIELHSEKVVPFFRIPVTKLFTHTLLSDKLPQRKTAVVVSPDKGGQSRSERFARQVQLPLVYLSKERNLTSGQVTVTGISGSVSGHDVVIFDDIINTGTTAIKTSEFLKRNGAGQIYFLATHAVLAGDADRKLDRSSIDQIVVTDTIFVPKVKQFDKLTIVSVAWLLAKQIKKMVKRSLTLQKELPLR